MAPAGSRDPAIRAAGYCMGQAVAQTKALHGSDGDASERQRLGLSQVFIAQRLTLLGAESQWMLQMVNAPGKTVENPDPKVLNGAMDRGKAAGAALFATEEQCRASCGDAHDVKELGACIDACAAKDNAVLAGAAAECDRLYLNRGKAHPASSR
jgi:hypothetical protein